jgi:sirohydrochlorin cobaltochelatase
MLILIAHGSRDPRWRESLETLTKSVLAASPSEEVCLAYMQFDGPTLQDVIEEGWRRGEREFRLLPLFMASAGHVDKDIRPLVKQLAPKFPGWQLEMLTPIGENPDFHDLIIRIATKDRG